MSLAVNLPAHLPGPIRRPSGGPFPGRTPCRRGGLICRGKGRGASRERVGVFSAVFPAAIDAHLLLHHSLSGAFDRCITRRPSNRFRPSGTRFDPSGPGPQPAATDLWRDFAESHEAGYADGNPHDDRHLRHIDPRQRRRDKPREDEDEDDQGPGPVSGTVRGR